MLEKFVDLVLCLFYTMTTLEDLRKIIQEVLSEGEELQESGDSYKPDDYSEESTDDEEYTR